MPTDSLRIEFFPQETEYSCAVACLRMVAHAMGIAIEEPPLRTLCKTDRTGTHIADLLRGAQALGLSAAIRNPQLSDLQATDVAIAYIDRFPLDHVTRIHAVVVERVGSTVTILDPNVGRRELSRDQFEQAWAGCRNLALIITRTN